MDIEDTDDEHSELDLTSEPSFASAGQNEDSWKKDPSQEQDSPVPPNYVQVLFRCCKVYWRFPIPADVVAGRRATWSVRCPRCAAKLTLP